MSELTKEELGVFNRKASDEIMEVNIMAPAKIVTVVRTMIKVGHNGHRDMNIKLTGTHRPHKDFLDAMNALRKEMCFMCELTSLKVARMKVLQVKFTTDPDDQIEGVILKADVENLNDLAQTWELKTPPTSIEDETKYSRAEHLDKLCSNVVKEAFRYIEGKNGEPQMTLPLDKDGKPRMTVEQQN